MAWKTPAPEEVAKQVRQSFRVNLPGTDASLWPNNVYVMAKVIARAVHGLYVWLDYIARQRFISTADGEFLDRHGDDYGVIRLAATYAEGLVDIVGAANLTLPAGLTFSGEDMDYELLTAVNTGDGQTTGKVRARDPGMIGNQRPGVELSATTADELQITVAADGVGGGADDEQDEPYRSRLLFHVRNPAAGGNRADYVRWMREINAAISHVAIDDRWNGPATGAVYFMMHGTYDNGIPLASDVKKAQAWLDFKRPVGVVITVMAPQAYVTDVTISGLAPDNVDVRDAVRAELRDLFEREMTISTLENPASVYRSKIWEAVSSASGEDHHALIAPADDILLDAGRVAILGEVHFV